MRSRARWLPQQSSWLSRCTRAGQRRGYQIQAAPSASLPASFSSDTLIPDAQFEVLGNVSSLLAVNLTASQRLFTRRGTLVAISGSPENVTSSLSSLSPFTRGFLGIPFLYQKLSSTTPLNLLVAAKAPHTSFTIVNLDGRLDWKVIQRKALLAWTGHSLVLKPTIDTSLSLAHWGSSTVSGRGLVALVGAGQTYQVKLVDGEQYIAHPSNVLAYAINRNPPQPYRFKSSSLNLQLPSLDHVFPNSKFFRAVRGTTTFKTLAKLMYHLRTWTRRTIWGDRLFLRFYGPTTILLQSRGSRIRDVLSPSNTNEIADVPAGFGTSPVAVALGADSSAKSEVGRSDISHSKAPIVGYASIGKDGKVEFTKS